MSAPALGLGAALAATFALLYTLVAPSDPTNTWADGYRCVSTCQYDGKTCTPTTNWCDQPGHTRDCHLVGPAACRSDWRRCDSHAAYGLLCPLPPAKPDVAYADTDEHVSVARLTPPCDDDRLGWNATSPGLRDSAVCFGNRALVFLFDVVHERVVRRCLDPLPTHPTFTIPIGCTRPPGPQCRVYGYPV
jgi:hypothetical protein